jgi:protein TonB
LVQALVAIGRKIQHLESVIRHLRLHIRVPAFYARMDFQSQVMTLAVGASVLFHATVLFVHFSFPDNHLFDTQSLDVVLVNSKSSTRPFYADALAQANLDGGGNTDKKRRAKTPLPALNRTEKGDALAQATARQRQLEAEQQQLLAQLKSTPVALPAPRANPLDTPHQLQNGADFNTTTLAIARLEAQIAQQVEEYQQRPRKAFVGARTQEVKYAQYAEDWRIMIERVGTLNYPEAARGGSYHMLQLTVEIRADGSIEKMHIDRSSGVKVIDQAAKRIVRMAAPFPAFPPSLQDTDIVVITRTWIFEPGGSLSTK